MESLELAAKEVLKKNWRNGFTVPSSNLYPFQWFWDSGFIALGWSYVDIEKARQEIETLMNAQWSNGFIPHIIFHDDSAEKAYFPGADFQKAHINEFSPRSVKTSGITQPPVLGFILEEIYHKEEDKNKHKDFYISMTEKIFYFHQYLYENRNIDNEGLVYIRHNWESGTDNSAAWDSIWSGYTPPSYEVERKDTTHVNQAQRPTKKDYDYYLNLIDISRECVYDEKKMFEKLPFIVLDPLFNALLIASNESLINLAKEFGLSEILDKVTTWNQKTVQSLNKLYDEKLGLYGYFDVKNNRFISIPTAPGLCPIFTSNALPKHRIDELIKTLSSENFAGNNTNDFFLCPSLAYNHPAFEARRYWRGPVWININWLLYRGCKKHGYDEIADRIKRDSITLISKNGFYEYFSPIGSSEQSGFGGQDFSWSAALFLDLIAKK